MDFKFPYADSDRYILILEGKWLLSCCGSNFPSIVVHMGLLSSSLATGFLCSAIAKPFLVHQFTGLPSRLGAKKLLTVLSLEAHSAASTHIIWQSITTCVYATVLCGVFTSGWCSVRL
jgi:hypothetical protein